MRKFVFATATIFLLFVPLAQAQQSGATESFCRNYDHTSEDVWKKTLAIQIRDSRSNGRVIDSQLNEKFSFIKALQSILDQVKLDREKNKTQAGRLNTFQDQSVNELVTTLIQGFRDKDVEERQPESTLPMTVSARKGELNLKSEDLLANDDRPDALFPVGLFNRFDLSSIESGHCGEARIVYAKKREDTPVQRRFFLIFEGKVMPQMVSETKLKPDGCRHVAQFWASLVDKQGEDRAELLRRFYFEGDMGDFGQLARPPMSYQNLGGEERGQVRGNIFVDGVWQLREWVLQSHRDRLTFDATTVKDNPLAEFYNSASKFTEAERGSKELADFQAIFTTETLTTLSFNNKIGGGKAVSSLPTNIQMVHGFGFGGKTASFDEFQSTSQGKEDIPAPDADFTKKIEAGGTKLSTKFLSSKNIIDRATALTCHGCHQPEGSTRPENFRLEIAPAIQTPNETVSAVFWPKSLNFVHIDEKSELSPALLTSFLPFRAAVLKDELCPAVEPTGAEEPSVAMAALRKAPAFFSGKADLSALLEEAQKAETETQRSAIQEAINEQQASRRRAERTLPGTFWPLRRTH